MEKRKACTILAILASVAFTAVYFFVFKNLKPQSMPVDDVVVKQPKSQENLSATTLYWVQLGVYKEPSSYEDLVKECAKLNMNPVLLDVQDKKILVVGCSEDEAKMEAVLNEIKEMEVEFMTKSATIHDETALGLIQQQDFKAVLEGFVY